MPVIVWRDGTKLAAPTPEGLLQAYWDMQFIHYPKERIFRQALVDRAEVLTGIRVPACGLAGEFLSRLAATGMFVYDPKGFAVSDPAPVESEGGQID